MSKQNAPAYKGHYEGHYNLVNTPKYPTNLSLKGNYPIRNMDGAIYKQRGDFCPTMKIESKIPPMFLDNPFSRHATIHGNPYSGTRHYSSVHW